MSEIDHVSGRQIAAARALLGLGQIELAAKANVSAPTLRRMEASTGTISAIPNNIRSVCRALEESGIEFIPENGGGPGVRLRDPERL